MLSILLMALLLAGAYGAIRTAIRAMHSGEALIDRVNRQRVAQEFIRHQVSGILPLAFARDQSTGTSFLFQGDRNFMRFVAAMPGYLSHGGPYVQTLELVNAGGGKQLLFTDFMLNGYDMDKLKAKDLEPVVLLDQIRNGRFQYRGLDEQGQLGEWTDKWDDPTLTPVMVRVVLTMQPEARTTFPEMDIPLKLDAGATRRAFFPAGGVPFPGGRPGGVAVPNLPQPPGAQR